MALRLARLFRNAPEFWMNAQRSVDLWDANLAEPPSDAEDEPKPPGDRGHRSCIGAAGAFVEDGSVERDDLRHTYHRILRSPRAGRTARAPQEAITIAP